MKSEQSYGDICGSCLKYSFSTFNRFGQINLLIRWNRLKNNLNLLKGCIKNSGGIIYKCNKNEQWKRVLFVITVPKILLEWKPLLFPSWLLLCICTYFPPTSHSLNSSSFGKCSCLQATSTSKCRSRKNTNGNPIFIL